MKGKLSVSTGSSEDEDDELLLEVDPGRYLTRIWTALEIDGPLIATGEVKASGLRAVGKIGAAVIEARSASFESAEIGTLAAVSAEVEKLATSAAQIAKLASEQLIVSGDASMGNLSVNEAITAPAVHAQSITAQTLEASKIAADSASIDQLSAMQGRLESLSASIIEVNAIEATTISAAKSISSAAISCTSLNATDIAAESVGASSLKANSISATSLNARSIAGALGSLRLPSDCCGSATFPAIDSSGEGLDATVVIEVNPKTSGIVATQCTSISPYLCMYEVAQIGDGRWEISRRFESAAMEALDNGSFPGIPETAIHWIAFVEEDPG
ncbi:MAG: hypothetical protein K6G78_07205 [bacterium]|nr:hypothetical protein [bacterium]